MKSGPEILKDRTKQFAVRVVKLVRIFPKNEFFQLYNYPVTKLNNYRAVCRARSKAEFIAKIGIFVEEADETVFWLELIVDLDILSQERMDEILKEANELVAIFPASNQTARGRK